MSRSALIILIIFLLGAGFLFGRWTAPEKVPEEEVEVEAPPTERITPEILETSKVIKSRSAIAQGLVTKISDRTLTLFAENETLSLPIKEGASVILQVITPEREIQTKPIKFNEIKIGDRVRIIVEITKEGFEGNYITIMPR